MKLKSRALRSCLWPWLTEASCEWEHTCLWSTVGRLHCLKCHSSAGQDAALWVGLTAYLEGVRLALDRPSPPSRGGSRSPRSSALTLPAFPLQLGSLTPLHIAAALPGAEGVKITELLLHTITDVDARAADQDDVYKGDQVRHLPRGGRALGARGRSVDSVIVYFKVPLVLKEADKCCVHPSPAQLCLAGERGGRAQGARAGCTGGVSRDAASDPQPGAQGRPLLLHGSSSVGGLIPAVAPGPTRPLCLYTVRPAAFEPEAQR